MWIDSKRNRISEYRGLPNSSSAVRRTTDADEPGHSLEVAQKRREVRFLLLTNGSGQDDVGSGSTIGKKLRITMSHMMVII